MICCPCHWLSLSWGNQCHLPSIWKRNVGKGPSQKKILKPDQRPAHFVPAKASLRSFGQNKASGTPTPLPHTQTHSGLALLPWALSWSGDLTSDQQSAWLSNCLRTQNIPDQVSHDSSAKNQQLFQLTSPGRAVTQQSGRAARWAGAWVD